ncbi:yteA family sporulation protein [Metabacillus fastidiosus]|uniref:yteA family sporulation protein n=1 Tax=Metabacillus fastidiosus TaxID=1458 RepID=UPI003D29A447
MDGLLNAQQIETFRSELLEMKKNIEQRWEQNEYFGIGRAFIQESSGELSNYDNHPGDTATELYEREKDIALNDHAEEEYEDIKRALEAIEKGTYGKCEICGVDIPFERLDIIPTATTCKEHSPEQAVSTDRPVEEDVLSPPFSRFFYDGEDVVAYDAEDSYQDVSRYGSSDGPSDFYESPDHYNDTYINSDEQVGYVESFENFIGTDIEGKEIKIYPNEEHEQYEDALDEEGIMTTFGDLLPYEKDPYTARDEK